MRLFRDLSISTATAGFVAVLVGFTSSIAIVFSAARALGATDAQVSSWVWAISIGTGGLTLLLSLAYRLPIMVAWSTPGAAVIATAATASGYRLKEAVEAFLVCALAIAFVGFSGLFERVMTRIPLSLAGALLAGVLSRFALDGVSATKTAPTLVVAMLVAYLAGRRRFPRYTMVAVLAVGIAVAALSGKLAAGGVRWSIARPVFVGPHFSAAAIVSIAVPLFVVTMAGQNLPGTAVIRTFDYPVPVSRVIGITGVATLLLAPFGGFALNLSAITAAICMGPAAHEDRDRRYTAAVCNGALYLLVGLGGAAVTSLLNAFPSELVRAVAALALLSTIAANLSAAVADEPTRDAAILTFLVTLSGVSLVGVGSAFWGAVAGVVALVAQRWRIKTPQSTG